MTSWPLTLPSPQGDRLSCPYCDGNGHRCDQCDGTGEMFADDLPERSFTPEGPAL